MLSPEQFLGANREHLIKRQTRPSSIGPSSESGSAVISHVLVQALVVLVVLALLQLGYGLHTRNTALVAAQTAARRVSLVGATKVEGQKVAEKIVAQALPHGIPPVVEVKIRPQGAGRMRLIEVMVELPVPLIGPWGIGHQIKVKSHYLQVE
ncbi:hypothetical protein BK816_02625 [Boudabousia tangfeifanii]|uniref:Pilus assembly protein TadE n=1 Tax=Boudabousia tangfeifanii TaxID=1912795 RepID=A0A1D9MJG8_9ACTO|nr:hypothetical protein [Boudabousia tangfeifanii]AOZ72329.1 hypothetical protein BK816_02625 [Boudabousia tangfeifanii]